MMSIQLLKTKYKSYKINNLRCYYKIKMHLFKKLQYLSIKLNNFKMKYKNYLYKTLVKLLSKINK